MTKSKVTTGSLPTRALDTTAEADEVQWRVLRAMKPEKRSMLAAEFSAEIRNTTLAGIRSRHPDWNEQQVIREFARLTIEPELFEQAYGSAEGNS